MNDNIRASLFMLVSMAGFSFNDAIVKSLGGAVPPTQIMAVRGSFLIVFLALLITRRGLWHRAADVFHPLVLIRALCEMGATILFLTALARLPFASVSAVLQALPLTVTLGAALLFGEPVGWRRWLAILIGFGGVLIIVDPAGEDFQVASLYVVGSVLFAAGRDLVTRRVPADIPSLLLTATTTLLVTLVGFTITSVSGSAVALDRIDLLTLLASGLFLGIGYHFIVLAMRIGDIAYVVPYRYTSLLWSILLGYVFYAEVPGVNTLIGSAIVIAMGLFALYRELMLARQLKGTKAAS